MTRVERESLRVRELCAQLGLRPVEPPAPEQAHASAPDSDGAHLSEVYFRVLDAVDDPRTVALAEHDARPFARRRRMLRPDLRAAAAVVLALAVIGTLWLGQAPSASAEPPVLAFSTVDGPLGPDAGVRARDALLAIAAAATDAPPPPRAADATSQHVVTDEWRLEVETDAVADRHLLIRPTHNESWLYADGRIRYLEVATGAAFSPDGRLVDSGSDAGDVVRDEIMPARGERGAHWASGLPRDPQALEASWLRWADDPAVDRPTSAAVVVAHEIAALFGTWVVTPDLAATAWTVLAGQDDVRDLGAVTDRAGRAGRAFGIWNANESALEVLIVDPASGALLGTELILVDESGSAEPVVGSFTLHRLAEWTSER